MRFILSIVLLSCLSLQSLAQRTYSERPLRKDWDGRNIITIQPIGLVAAFTAVNPCSGIEYEYIVSKKLGLGIHVPIMFGFNGPEQDFGNDYTHTIFYTAPGIRFHVGGRGRGREHLDFATGPSIIIGNQHYKPYNNGYYPNPNTAYDLTVTGLVADNVLNIQRGNFIFGFNNRVGYTFDRQRGTQFVFDLGIHFGGHFL